MVRKGSPVRIRVAAPPASRRSLFAFHNLWNVNFFISRVSVASFLLGISTGEPPELVRILHFVECEFFIFRVIGTSFLLPLSKCNGDAVSGTVFDKSDV